MATERAPDQRPAADLSESQLRAVLRVGGAALLLALAVPVYALVSLLAPPVAQLVPPSVPLLATAAGLLVGLPATFLYAHLLAHRTDHPEQREPRQYGPGDEWERANL